MKTPFCENSECILNKMLVEPNFARVLVEKKEIFRHVYKKKGGNVPSEITHLCGVCHNAIQIVR